MTRLLLVTCLAASAGIHSALAAEHGLSFHVAAALLALDAGVLAVRPGRAAALGAGALLLTLLGAYALEHGLAADGIATATKAAEATGVVLAARLALATPARRPERVATLVAAGMIAVLAAAVTPGGTHEHPAGAPVHGH